jgi:hypothetical protein
MLQTAAVSGISGRRDDSSWYYPAASEGLCCLAYERDVIREGPHE